MKVHRVGRMSRWQRWSIFIVMGVCLVSGVTYFLRQDLLDLPPSANRLWWILHGATSLIAILAIGAALSQHVLVAWRARRGRITGSINLVFLGILVVTTLVLFYGLETWHDAAHWIHVVAGLLAVVAFPGHILWGRTRAAKLRRFTTAS
jgi:hypothetical protein